MGEREVGGRYPGAGRPRLSVRTRKRLGETGGPGLELNSGLGSVSRAIATRKFCPASRDSGHVTVAGPGPAWAPHAAAASHGQLPPAPTAAVSTSQVDWACSSPPRQCGVGRAHSFGLVPTTVTGNGPRSGPADRLMIRVPH